MNTLGTKLILGSAVLALLTGYSTAQSASDSSNSSAGASAPAQQQTQTASPSNGQESKPAESNEPADQRFPTIRAVTNEVNVVFTVTDKHGRRITDLKQSDFQVLDDNKPPQEIRSFHAETNLPLQVGLLDRRQQLGARSL